jgi:hypothetical protein
MSYKVIRDGLRGFAVEVTAPGCSASASGFPTEVAAEEWMAEQQHADDLVAHAATLPAAPVAQERIVKQRQADALIEHAASLPAAPSRLA